MRKRLSIASRLSVICFMSVALVVLALPAISRAMVMSPHRIILNASPEAENNQDIQAIISYSDSIPINLDNAESTLSIASATFDAINIGYCYIDDNFLISFDREEIQNNPVVQELANQGSVDVTVEVAFDGKDNDGNIARFTITGTAEVEILAPGRKSGEK